MAHTKYHSCTLHTSHTGPRDPVSLNKYFNTQFMALGYNIDSVSQLCLLRNTRFSSLFPMHVNCRSFFFLAERRRLPGESWGHVKKSANTLHGRSGRKRTQIYLENPEEVDGRHCKFTRAKRSELKTCMLVIKLKITIFSLS